MARDSFLWYKYAANISFAHAAPLGGCGSERNPHPPLLRMADYNVILGTNTADNLVVSNTSGTDSLAVLSGNDTVTGSGGIDIVDFGKGNDLLTTTGDYTGRYLARWRWQ